MAKRSAASEMNADHRSAVSPVLIDTGSPRAGTGKEIARDAALMSTAASVRATACVLCDGGALAFDRYILRRS
jgi:hypothetical protein